MDINHRVAAAGSGGSFWQGHLARDQRGLSRMLSALFHDSAMPGMVRAAVAGWSGETRQVFTMRSLPYHPDMVLSSGGGLNQRDRLPSNSGIVSRAATPPTVSTVLAGEGGMVLGTESMLAIGADLGFEDPTRDSPAWYLLPVPAGLTVVQLAGHSELLNAGPHFTSRPGYMVFHDHPDRWLSPPSTLAVVGFEVLPLFADYTLGADTMAGTDVATYYRKLQTQGQLLKAACAAAGLTRVETDTTITEVQEYLDEGAVYNTTSGLLEARYYHQLLSVGDSLTAGTYIGAAPELVNTPGAWWIDAPWGAGLDMSQFSPWDLFVPNDMVTAEAYDSGGAKPHTRLLIDGDPEVLADWHAACAAGEIATDCWLADYLSLGVGDRTTVNPLWLFSELMWHTSALVVLLNAPDLEEPRRGRLRSFLQRERPFGTLLLTLD